MTALLSFLRRCPLGELLSGSAHDAHPTDVTTPLGVRFAGRTILVVHTALDRAATVRVSFDRSGTPRLSGIRNIKQRFTAEFSEVLRAEVAATHAQWAVVVMATGWQALLGQRAARGEPGERTKAFARHRLMFETPEVIVPRAQLDRVYTAVDHPVLDKSVVFSVKRREVEEIAAELRRCGLGIAAVRIGVAAQLEAWLTQEGEQGLGRDLLVTDGLSALLLNTQQGDFVPPRGAVDSEQPRQSVQRPSAVEEDIVRFLANGAQHSLTFLGPEELCAALKRSLPELEVIRQPEHPAHETQAIALASQVQHDLNFEAREVRPPIPRRWRRFTFAYVGLILLLGTLTAFNAAYAVRARYAAYQLERESARRAEDTARQRDVLQRVMDDFTNASQQRTWVSGNYHAQRLCSQLLRELPERAGLDRLSLEMKESQLVLGFTISGDEPTQLAAHRAVERAIAALKFKIAGEDVPAAGAGHRAVQYRMNLIPADAGEIAAL